MTSASAADILQPRNVDSQAQDPAAVEQATAAAQADARTLENARELRREAVRIHGGLDVLDVTVVVGYKDALGQRHEVIRQVQDSAEFRIIKCSHDIEEQTAVKKAEGEIIGHEPTGKYRLKLDLVYVRN